MGAWSSRGLVSVWLVLCALVTWPGGAAAAGMRWTAGRDRAAGDLVEVACPSAVLCASSEQRGRCGSRRILRAEQAVGTSCAGSRFSSGWHVGPAEDGSADRHDGLRPLLPVCAPLLDRGRRRGAAGSPPRAAGGREHCVQHRSGSRRGRVAHGLEHRRQRRAIVSLSCPGTHLCHALENVTDTHGNITAIPLITHNPTGPAGGWTRTGGTVANYTEGLACPTRALCVAATGLGMYASANALAPAANWRFAMDTNQTGQIDSVACPSAHLCLAAPDNAGLHPVRRRQRPDLDAPGRRDLAPGGRADRRPCLPNDKVLRRHRAGHPPYPTGPRLLSQPRRYA